MLKILILEDDHFKFEHIKHCIEEALNNDCAIDHFEDYHSAGYNIFKNNYNLAVLDNTVPFWKDDPTRFIDKAATCLLEEMWLEENNTPTIICSSDDVEAEDHWENLLGIVKYKVGNIDWEKKLIDLLTKFIE